MAQAVTAAAKPQEANPTPILAFHFDIMYVIFGKFQKAGTANATGKSR